MIFNLWAIINWNFWVGYGRLHLILLLALESHLTLTHAGPVHTTTISVGCIWFGPEMFRKPYFLCDINLPGLFWSFHLLLHRVPWALWRGFQRSIQLGWSLLFSAYCPALCLCICSHLLQEVSLVIDEQNLTCEYSIMSLGIILWLHFYCHLGSQPSGSTGPKGKSTALA